MVSGGTSNEVLPWYGSYLLEGGKRRRDQSKFEVGQREKEGCVAEGVSSVFGEEVVKLGKGDAGETGI